jgi:hypothetical protein
VTPEAVAVLRGLVKHGPAIISTHTNAHGRCVLASRVAFAVLQRHGIAAQPIAVQLTGMNRQYVEWVARHGTMEDFYTSGAWLVTNAPQWRKLLPQPRWPRWMVPYHVVLELPTLGALLDLDLRQTRVPDRHILPPDALVIDWDGRRAEHHWSSRGAVHYLRWPDDVGDEIRAHPVWTHGPHSRIAEEIERALETERSLARDRSRRNSVNRAAKAARRANR